MKRIITSTLILGAIILSSFFQNAYAFTTDSYLPEQDRFEIREETKRENIIINLNDDVEWEYMIFTEDGSCVRMGILEKGKNKISLKDMCKGEYFVYLSNGKQRYMEKVKQ